MVSERGYYVTYPGSLSNPSKLFRVVNFEDWLTWFNAPAHRRFLFPVHPVSEHKSFAEADAACNVLNGVSV